MHESGSRFWNVTVFFQAAALSALAFVLTVLDVGEKIGSPNRRYVAVVLFVLFVVFVGIAVAGLYSEIAALKTRLDDREKWRAIAHRLGGFGDEGKAFVPKPYVKVAPWSDIDPWKERVGVYLENNLGKGYRFLFDSGAGNEPTVPDKIAHPDDQERWINVQARLMTIKKLLWEITARADRPTP